MRTTITDKILINDMSYYKIDAPYKCGSFIFNIDESKFTEDMKLELAGISILFYTEVDGEYIKLDRSLLWNINEDRCINIYDIPIGFYISINIITNRTNNIEIEEFPISIIFDTTNISSSKSRTGVSIKESKVNDSGELIIIYTDGSSDNVGKVVGADGKSIISTEISKNNELILTYSDGSTANVGVVKGKDGKNYQIETIETIETTVELQPNKFYKFGEVIELNLTLAEIADNTQLNEYMFEFVSGETATTLTLPDTIKWSDVPTVEANRVYQCSIVNNIGLIVGVDNV